MPDTMTTLEALRRETVVCPHCGGTKFQYRGHDYHHIPCPHCHGTGLVLRYLELTEACPDTRSYLHGEAIHDARCCSDSGRVLKQGPALLVAVEECLGPHSHYFDGEYHTYESHLVGDFAVFGIPDRLAAAVSALAALGQRGKDGMP